MSGRTQGLCPEVSVIDMDLVEDGLQVSNVRNLKKKKKKSEIFYPLFLMAIIWGHSSSFFGCNAWHPLGPLPGIEIMPPVIEAQSLNHWTTGKIPGVFF